MFLAAWIYLHFSPAVILPVFGVQRNRWNSVWLSNEFCVGHFLSAVSHYSLSFVVLWL